MSFEGPMTCIVVMVVFTLVLLVIDRVFEWTDRRRRIDNRYHEIQAMFERMDREHQQMDDQFFKLTGEHLDPWEPLADKNKK